MKEVKYLNSRWRLEPPESDCSQFLAKGEKHAAGSQLPAQSHIYHSSSTLHERDTCSTLSVPCVMCEGKDYALNMWQRRSFLIEPLLAQQKNALGLSGIASCHYDCFITCDLTLAALFSAASSRYSCDNSSPCS